MIVISLALVIAAAVSLFIGLFVVTDTLTFIFAAIVLCLVSLLLLWLGTRSRTATAPASPSAPVYGGGVRAGGAAPPRTSGDRTLDDLTAPDSGTVVRKTTARDRAATRVWDGPPAQDGGTQDTDAAADETPPTPVEETSAPLDAAATGEATRPATKKPSTRKATARKVVKKPTATKATGKKATAAKATAAKAGATTGAQARARLAQISGVGPAKQDALLAHYGSLEAIRDASVDDIVANVRGFGSALASRVKDELS